MVWARWREPRGGSRLTPLHRSAAHSFRRRPAPPRRAAPRPAHPRGTTGPAIFNRHPRSPARTVSACVPPMSRTLSDTIRPEISGYFTPKRCHRTRNRFPAPPSPPPTRRRPPAVFWAASSRPVRADLSTRRGRCMFRTGSTSGRQHKSHDVHQKAGEFEGPLRQPVGAGAPVGIVREQMRQVCF